MIYAKKTLISVFVIGLLALAILSVLGLVYLTRMAYNDKPCGDISTTERNIARLSAIVLWLQFTWIVVGSFLQSTWAS